MGIVMLASIVFWKLDEIILQEAGSAVPAHRGQLAAASFPCKSSPTMFFTEAAENIDVVWYPFFPVNIMS